MRGLRRLVVFVLAAVLAGLAAPGGASRRFLDDDPLTREPNTQDASKVKDSDIDLFVDIMLNLFILPREPAPEVRAQNVNTIDEVPDSSWFTNRVLARPIALDELARGPLTGDGPAPGQWTLTSPKVAGFAPGFTIRDSRDQLWFVSFDAAGYPEAATAAIAVATRLFWALGYFQSENHLVSVKADQIVVASSAVFTPVSGRTRPMRKSDLDDVLRRAHRSKDGSYRAIASRALPGRVVGGFHYYGTRPDDPNDIVPHEHRRELRALHVFGAWTNLVDMKAGNTLDTVVTENGTSVVRHYLQDVGSTFGTGANGPREYDEGWEYIVDLDLAWKRFSRIGFLFSPWQTARYDEQPAIGRFEGESFDPLAWRPRVSTVALRNATADDVFWAARRVAAFTDEMIRAAVHTGQFSDPQAEALLAKVLAERRQKIASAYLPVVNPLVDFTLSTSGQLAFRNAAVEARVSTAPANGYRVDWARFDNATGDAASLGSTTTLGAPAPLPSTPGAFVRLLVSAIDPAPAAWTKPVGVYFRLGPGGWTLVGVDRHP